MKVLVTGGTGMVGSHFMSLYQSEGHDVYGLARNSAASRIAAVQPDNIIRCDVLERDALMDVFNALKPDIILHMAAQAFNGESWKMEYMTHRTNYLGTLNVLHCARKLNYDVKVLLACSSAEYGNIKPEDCPLREDRPLLPWTPYGVSKAGVEMLGRQYALNYGLKVFLPRMFIHVGTGHPPVTAIQNFARQLALIKKCHIEPTIHVGNLETARDFIDVRDGTAAMKLLIEKGQPGEPYNICTGKAHKIESILNTLIELAEIDVQVVHDQALYRVADEPLLLGDNTKLTALGWKPKYSIRDTLLNVLEDWYERVG